MAPRPERGSVSRSNSSCTPPELRSGTPSQNDDESVGTTVASPALLGVGDAAHELGALPLTHTGDDWNFLVHDLGALFGEHAHELPSAKEMHALPSAADHVPWAHSALRLPPAPLALPVLPEAPKRTARAVSAERPAKQTRVRAQTPRFPTYTPPALLSMDPRPMTPSTGTTSATGAMQAWLLERRALLQKARDDVTKDAARLDADQAAMETLRTRLAERIDTLRRTHGALGDEPPSWDMAALLEQDILCL